MPDAELKWIEECGHVPHLEQPEVTASTILNFLKSEKVVAATAVATKSKRWRGANGDGDSDGDLELPPYIIGGGFLAAISGAYLLEEVIQNLIGL